MKIQVIPAICLLTFYDKKVNIFDSVVLKRFVAGIETDIDKNNADFNSDGNIGISDLIQLNKFLIKY